MIKYLFCPRPSGSKKIEYSFEGEKLKVKLRKKDNIYTDEFDFSGMPEGVVYDMETELPEKPCVMFKLGELEGRAIKKDGVVYIKLITYIPSVRDAFEKYGKGNYGVPTKEWQEV